MSSAKILNTGVDLYKLRTNNGGSIEFDTPGGGVTINGNLSVIGASSSISSSELIVTDNKITLNNGETGPGITVGTSGIEIDRGSLPNADWIFDESLSFPDSQTGLSPSLTLGAWTTEKANGDLVGIFTNFIGTYNNDNLILLGNPGGVGSDAVITVTGTSDYHKNIFPYSGSVIQTNISNPDRLENPNDPDAIPTIKSVKDYIYSYHLYNFQDQLRSPIPDGDTRIELFDTAAGDASSRAEIAIDGSVAITVFATQTNIEEVSFVNNTISVLNTNGNLKLTANGTGSVEFPDPLLLTKDTNPVAPADGVKLYSKEEADGGTGLFFINDNGTNDEIISRNKALLYSIIF
jgi:hypothetical protein